MRLKAKSNGKIIVIDALSMKKITELNTAPFPVGMELSRDTRQLVTIS